MPWEPRGQKWVYYRAKKVAGRVVKTYIGGGERGARAAAEDDARRAERQAGVESLRAEQARLRAAEAAVASLADAVRAAVHAHLLLGGYHRHDRGHWRHRRGG